MKIMFLTPHINISGGVKIILGYADRLAKRGHKVTVVCPQSTFVKKKIKGMFVIYPKRFLMNFVNFKPSWIKVAAEIKYVPSYDERFIPDADIVVATAWHTAQYVIDYSLKKGRKFYLIQHYESLYHGERDKVDKTYSYPFKKVVVSTWLKKILREKFDSDAELILNPIDLDLFNLTRSNYNKNKRICMLHHKFEWKGISDGIEAFKIAKQKYPNTQLVMFGCHKKNIDTDCEYYYRPIRNKLNEIYNSCDIFLSPSWAEGFGLPSAEAMACKCALVTTDNGGSQDYAIHKKTAMVSPPKSPQALAENLIRLLEDENFMKMIAQNGYEHIKQFTWDKAVDKMEKLFLQEFQEAEVKNT